MSSSGTKTRRHEFVRKFMPNQEQLPAVTRKELAMKLQSYYELDLNLCRIVVDLFFEVIREELLNSEPVRLSSFGTFSIVNKRARPGLIISTREKVMISPRKVVRFKPSKKIRMIDYYRQKEADDRLFPNVIQKDPTILDIIRRVQESHNTGTD